MSRPNWQEEENKESKGRARREDKGIREERRRRKWKGIGEWITWWKLIFVDLGCFGFRIPGVCTYLGIV